jgi:hypothetical protein
VLRLIVIVLSVLSSWCHLAVGCNPEDLEVGPTSMVCLGGLVALGKCYS